MSLVVNLLAVIVVLRLEIRRESFVTTGNDHYGAFKDHYLFPSSELVGQQLARFV